MGDAFEKTANEMGLGDDFVKNQFNPFKSKEAKEKTREELGEKVLEKLKEKAKDDPKLKEHEEKLEELEKKRKNNEPEPEPGKEQHDKCKK